MNGTIYSNGFEDVTETSSGHNLSLSATAVSFSGGSSAKVVTSDIPLQNGVMHIIDTVLTDTEKAEASGSGGRKGIDVHGTVASVTLMAIVIGVYAGF